jgi:hypothetical protein
MTRKLTPPSPIIKRFSLTRVNAKNSIPKMHFFVNKIKEISEKAQKSLITSIMKRLQRLEGQRKRRKIFVIIIWNLCNRESE